jgi:hypothetical protein
VVFVLYSNPSKPLYLWCNFWKLPPADQTNNYHLGDACAQWALLLTKSLSMKINPAVRPHEIMFKVL